MDAIKQFLGGIAFVCASALVYSAARRGLDLGALADWVAGAATAAGVWVALSTAQKASQEAREAAAEARLVAQRDRARLLYREHHMAYAAALNAVDIAVHRINSTKGALTLDRPPDRITTLFLIRQLEADHALISGVNLLLLDATTAHQVTSVAGALMSAVDALNVIVDANPLTGEEAASEAGKCVWNLHHLCTVAAQVRNRIFDLANEGIAPIAKGFGIDPIPFRRPDIL